MVASTVVVPTSFIFFVCMRDFGRLLCHKTQVIITRFWLVGTMIIPYQSHCHITKVKFKHGEKVTTCCSFLALLYRLQARTQDFRMGGGTTPKVCPHADGPPAKKKRLRSSIHPGRSQSQDGPSQA